MLKLVNNLIIFLLCVSLIGFFANFAQNDYGAVLTAISFWLIAGCFFIKALNEVTFFKKVLGIALFLFFISFILNFISEEILVFIYFSLLVFITFIYPVIGWLRQRNQAEKINWILYCKFLLFGFIFLGIYLKELHFFGAGILLSLSLLQVVIIFIEILKNRKEIIKNISGIIYFIFSLNVITLLIATTFKIQHWPGSLKMFQLSPYLFLTLIIVYIYAVLKKQQAFQNFNIDNKIILVLIAIINIHGVLRYFQIVPKIYRNDMPTTYYEIDAKANDLTGEGRKYMSIRNDFKVSYEALVEEIEGNQSK
jgi:hypothetical protein